MQPALNTHGVTLHKTTRQMYIAFEAKFIGIFMANLSTWNRERQFQKLGKSWMGCRPSVWPQDQVMRISDRIMRSWKTVLQGRLTKYFFLKNQRRKQLENIKFPSTNNAVIPSTVEVLCAKPYNAVHVSILRSR